MPRILVADDNTNIQKMVALAFQDRGFDVTAVSNGEAAVRRIPELNPDVILADIFMPVRNGYEVCEWVKSEEKFAHIPVILLVGAFDPLDEKEARRVGADGVLKKPFIPPDPLIAMVTSALEKNSAASAAPAKKEDPVVAAQPPLVPVKAPIAQAVAFPQFQDSDADDASLAYGFGSGRRTLEEEGATEPVQPREEGAGDDVSEEFEGASTTKDWRRSAMEFEIPEGTSPGPSFASEEASSEGATGSEHPSAAETSVAVALSHQAAKSEVEPSPPVWPVQAEAAGSPEAGRAAEPVHQTGLSPIRPTSLSPIDPVAHPSASIPIVAAERPWERSIESEAQEAPRVEAPANPEPSFASKAVHWMDLVGSAAEKPQGNWFTTIFGSRKHTDKPELSPERASAKALAVAPDLPAAAAVIPETAAISSEPEVHATELPHSRPVGAPGDAAPEAAVEPAIPQAEAGDEPFFADEPESTEAAPAVSPVVSMAGSETSISIDPEVAEQIAKHGEEAVQTEELPELVSESCVEPVLVTDPQLIEPPAVHVTPEPLLVDETPKRSPAYGARERDIAPLYSFLSAMPKSPAPAEVAEEPVAAPSPAAPPADHGNEAGSLQFSASEFDQPGHSELSSHREALSEIAFLNPPPSFHRSEFEHGSHGADSNGEGSASPEAIDAIVQKVLEKIEPQIRELLSQNVLRPLVENLLQSELEKKAR